MIKQSKTQATGGEKKDNYVTKLKLDKAALIRSLQTLDKIEDTLHAVEFPSDFFVQNPDVIPDVRAGLEQALGLTELGLVGTLARKSK